VHICNLSEDAIALLIYGLINYVHSFCSNMFHSMLYEKVIAAFAAYLETSILLDFTLP